MGQGAAAANAIMLIYAAMALTSQGNNLHRTYSQPTARAQATPTMSCGRGTKLRVTVHADGSRSLECVAINRN